MGKLQRLTGAPWHVEKMVREEDDGRRHRSRCVNYRGKADSYCSYYCGRCRGAAHCDHYEEREQIIERIEIEKKTEKENMKPFDGVKFIPVSSVIIDSKFSERPPKEEKIIELISFYKTHGEMDKPIVIECAGTKYRLTDKYLRFVVAQRLGLKELPAEFGTKEETKQRDSLRKRGGLVWHNKNADVGEVIEVHLDKIKVKFDSGIEKIYDIHGCLQSGTIRPL